MMSSNRDATVDATARVLDVYERQAPYDDRIIAVAERLLYAGGPEWACRQVRGDVLEVGVGTGRNLPCLPEDIALSGIELSPAMLARAEVRADDSDGPSTCASGMHSDPAWRSRSRPGPGRAWCCV